MSDTDRLYALSSTFTTRPWGGAEAPRLLINDALLAMRWYLTHEREPTSHVTSQVSDDGGSTWQPLAPHQLMADAEHALVATGQAASTGLAHPRLVDRLKHALSAEAAEWLGHRIRLRGPAFRGPGPVDLAAWQRAGTTWATVLHTVPHAAVLAQLASRYPDERHEGPQRMRAAAFELLNNPDFGHHVPADPLTAVMPPHPHTPAAGEEGVSAVPGYPRPLLDELQAAAAWRLVSPVHRRIAEHLMKELAKYEGSLAMAQPPAGRPASPAEQENVDRARTLCDSLREGLRTLDRHHAMLMHASMLADAHEAAAAARHRLMVAAAQSAETREPPGLDAPEAFVHQLEEGERRIDRMLAQQQQLTRAALGDLFPSGRAELDILRTQVTSGSGLSPDDPHRASSGLSGLQSHSRNGDPSPGQQPFTTGGTQRERREVLVSGQHADDLSVSNPVTWRALAALDHMTATAGASPGDRAAQAARIAAAVRRRTRQQPSTAARARRVADHSQQAHLLQLHACTGHPAYR